jgi:hypothetical protein
LIGQSVGHTIHGIRLLLRSAWATSERLCGALAWIGRTIPNYRSINVDTAVGAIFADKLKAVDAGVKASDVAQFNTAYGEMTAACKRLPQGHGTSVPGD